MTDIALALATLVILGVAAALGALVLRFLPDQHRTPQTMGFVQTVSSLSVTFTALVLSLLITSVNADFKAVDNDLRHYAADIVRLDAGLVAYGAQTEPIRSILRTYTAAALASTWADETPPSGTYPKAAQGPDIDAANLGDLLGDAEAAIRALDGTDRLQVELQKSLLGRIDALRDLRWTLVNEAHSSISPSFFVMMLFWLLIVFFSFGLSAPRNTTAATFILLVGLSVAGAIFVILELDGPLDGIIKVSSEPMRHALAHLDGRS